ncbi:hypothetical protein ILYODFUR_004513, partial [Ilyodon furcidens]
MHIYQHTHPKTQRDYWTQTLYHFLLKPTAWLTSWMVLPPISHSTSLKITQKMLALAAGPQAAGHLRARRSTSPLIPTMFLLLMLCLQPSESRTDPETRPWSQTGPRLQLSHS